jgi:ubiquitin
MTLIIGARCNDGVVLIGDRKVTGGMKDYTDKIKRLGSSERIVFTAAGVQFLFEEFLTEVNRNFVYKLEYMDKVKEEDPKQDYGFTATDFKHTCVETIKKQKQVYSEMSESPDEALQVLFTVPESKNGTEYHRLYFMDMEDCVPVPIEEGKIVEIGYSGIGRMFLKSLETKDFTIRDVARLGAFVIKYVESENLANGNVGVGNHQPQIWFMEDGKDPKEIVGKELSDLIEGVDGEVITIRQKIGSLSNFLRS